MHALLAHVRSRGIAWVPEPQGVDASGREILAFVDGEVPHYPMPEWVWRQELLSEAATRLREFHDATTGFHHRGAVWQLPEHAPVEVICHNDFAPYNMVFRHHDLVGVIDFDTCSPGSRLWDLAYLAYRLVPFHNASHAEVPYSSNAVRTERLHLLCLAYGQPATPHAVLETAIARVRDLRTFTANRIANASAPAALREHLRMYEEDIEYLAELTDV